MTPSDAKLAEVTSLLTLLCDGEMDQRQWDRLETLLIDDPTAQDFYRRFVALDVDLAWRAAGRLSAVDGPERPGSRRQSAGTDVGSADQLPKQPSEISDSPTFIPPIILDLSPTGRVSSGLLDPGGFPLAYAISALMVGLGLLIGWTLRVSDDRQFDPIAPRDAREVVGVSPQTPPVGRITGVADCQWADPATKTVDQADVSVGRTYALASGFMEITYASGVKVILEGPCTYAVESAGSGYLSRGKLTARVEKKGSGFRGTEVGSAVVGSAVELPNQLANRLPNQLAAPGAKGERTANPTLSPDGAAPIASLAPRPSPLTPVASALFSVRTPTAVVTDLGTEFGVEVDKAGESNVHVFSGRVELAPYSNSGAPVRPRRLGAGQMARVDHTGIRPLAFSGLEPMAAMRKHMRPRGFVQNFRLGVEDVIFKGDAHLKSEEAAGHGSRLRLTDDKNNQTGSAWRATKQSAAYGFSTEFAFQFSSPLSGGADGMAFVVQNTLQGPEVSLVGHKGVADHALNVCFDSYQNPEDGDPSNASIVVRAGAKVLGRVDLNARFGLDHLGDSIIHVARINYVPGRLDVYFDGASVLAKLPVDLTTLDGGSAVDADGLAWIGFSARTGAAVENHDVLEWRFVSREAPRPPGNQKGGERQDKN